MAFTWSQDLLRFFIYFGAGALFYQLKWYFAITVLMIAFLVGHWIENSHTIIEPVKKSK